MKASSQPTLPTLTDWSEPQTVASHALASTIMQANAAGFDAVRMTALKPSGYLVSFQRMPDELLPCSCDLCQSLSQPSDLIAATLRHSAALDAARGTPAAQDATSN